MSASGQNEPVNLLACDGGGIRGVSELVILDEVMKRMQQKGDLAKVPKPCDYFHLIGGTSTGGLVAIMLGRLQMSTEEALKAYDSFASEIFSKRRKSLVEKYKAKALEETVKNLVRDQGKGFSMRDARSADAKGRAFVCTMPEQRHKEIVRLRTYDVKGDKYPNCLIFEAARATTAATTYFKPMLIKDEEGNEEKFVDAALGTNNPISILWDEASDLFGKKRKLGCVVSLGTGSRDVEMKSNGDRMVDKTRYLISALKLTKELGTDSEKDHLRWKAKFEEFENTYFRLNVDGGAQGIELSDWQKIGELKRRTREYLQDPEVKKMIDDLADVLLDGKDSGLTLAHGGGLSRETTIPAEPKAIRRGKSSNIFTGRTAILGRLNEYFGPRAPGDTSRREFHLRGMGGVGKTQIALKFTEQNERRFHILWVDATDTTTIEQGYKQLAANIFGPTERKNAVEDVLLWLHDNDEEWLLVFDNAPASGLSKYLPDGDRGNVLYTSRHRNLQPRLRPECVADIGEMGIQDSVILLLRSAQQSEFTDESRDFAKDIVRALGCLPLAIDQAGAYIHMGPCPLKDYLEIFNEQKDALLRNPRFKGGDEQRHIAVYATFNISHRAIKAYADKKADMARVKDAEVALKLLNLVCFYNHVGDLHAIFDQAAKFRYEMQRHLEFPLKAGDISLDDLVWTFKTDITTENPDGRAWDSEDYVRGMSFLNDFSLIKFDSVSAYCNMHVLVHEWARNRMGDGERSDWGLAARSILMDSLSLKSGHYYIIYRRDVTPHLEACQKYVKAEHDSVPLESEYQGKMAYTFQQAGNMDAAEIALTKALEYRKRIFGVQNEATFAAMSQLAQVYVKQGRYAKAEETLREVIDRRKLYQQELKQQAIEEAQKLARKGKGKGKENGKDNAVFLDADGTLDNPKIRKDTKNLLKVLILQDRWEVAANIASGITEWYEGMDLNNDKVRTYRNFVARLKGETTEDDLTIQEAMQKLADTTALMGPIHPNTIRDTEKLAQTLARHGGLLEAQKLLMEVFEWTQGTYGPESPEAFEAMCKVAHNLFSQGRYFEADDVYYAVETHYNEALGPLHPKTLAVKLDLGLCLYCKTMYSSAIRLAQECLEGRTVILGPQHTMTLQAEHCLRQFRETQANAPDWFRAGLRNTAIQASINALGDRAPDWMKQWKPESEEDLVRAHIERGTFRKLKLDIVTEKGGLIFTRLRPVDEADQILEVNQTLRTAIKGDGES
ncbi:Patatin-like protein 2 [Cytospora mali]|uniref:Patatin-like protein 2 n=1 Tax=Cytospora mali TaxID=578113 RepID=A0A194V006_CYTMA|nr:Patatin-like protein 2 [Valsa mali var. pyri (nom. inval.)]